MSLDKDQIAAIVRKLETLRLRIDEVHEALKRNIFAEDIHRLRDQLAAQFNKLVDTLDKENIEHGFLKEKIVEPDKPANMHWLQEIFVTNGIDVRDMTQPDHPPRSMFGDGFDF
jgi:hypothetical protein